MGQKVNPISLRLGITQDWRSRWYADKKEFAGLLVSDQKIRKHVTKNYAFAGIAKVEIALAQGKKSWDRRQDERNKDARREAEQALYRNRRR